MPRRVSGKFSIRLVPDMEPEKTGELVKKHLERMWAEEVGSKYKLTVNMIHGGPAWVSSTDHPNYVAATRAVEKVFKRPPDLTREGGSIPVANWLADATGMNVLLLPTSASNDGAHAQNEKWDKTHLVNAGKVLATPPPARVPRCLDDRPASRGHQHENPGTSTRSRSSGARGPRSASARRRPRSSSRSRASSPSPRASSAAASSRLHIVSAPRRGPRPM